MGGNSGKNCPSGNQGRVFELDAGLPKVERHLAARGMSPVQLSEDEMRNELEHIRGVADGHGLRIHGCCVPVLPVSKCIDGELLSRIHPDGLVCTRAKAKGQRALCGCTNSLDIGWYEPCSHGCIYCYANPKVE